MSVPFVIKDSDRRNGIVIVTWSGLTEGAEGAPVNLPGYALRSMQWLGTPGFGFDAICDVSNEDSPELFDEVLPTRASDVGFVLCPNPIWANHYRPRVFGGDDETDVTVIALFTRG